MPYCIGGVRRKVTARIGAPRTLGAHVRKEGDRMELIKLIGIVIVVIGFALKLDSILVIMIAAVATALVSGLDPVVFLQTLGDSFVSNRSMLIFIIVMVVTGTLERNGLKQAAAALMQKVKSASAGVVIGIYGIFRLVFAAFNVSFGGVAGFVRPIVMPMAVAAGENRAGKVTDRYLEHMKGMASGMENVAWFFGQMLFVGTSGALLVQGTLRDLGYETELIDLMTVQIPIAVIATAVTIGFYLLLDRAYTKQSAQAEGPGVSAESIADDAKGE